MALPHQSIATINSPQFINLQPLDVNPLMSACEIKVLYIGENRNRSYISKEVAAEMAKTLRGAPIVGYFKESKEDFADHGEQMVWDDQGIHFNCLTKPYGFVAPDAKVWFQKFNDSDEFGNEVQREYLMTTGYLWTGQYEQVQSVINEGKPHSMELDDATLDGHWATNSKSNIEFFIINDAIFTKLCILGDDTEPCFQGSSITKPMISANFSKTVDDNFKQTLFSMMKDLQNALKGGYTMEKEVNLSIEEPVAPQTEFSEEKVELSEPVVDESPDSTDFTEEPQQVEEPETAFEEESESSESEPEAEFAKEDKQDEEQKQDSDQEQEEDDKEEEDEDDKKKYSLLEQQYNELSTQYEQLKADYATLVEFKNQIEKDRKTALIKEFYMLSNEDKKDVIENMDKYSYDEIKAKLAVICFQKKVNFNLQTQEEIDSNKEQNIVTFSYSEDNSNLPDWVKAVKNNIDTEN